MKVRSLVAMMMVAVAFVSASANAKEPNVEKLLEDVRRTAVLQRGELTGTLKRAARKYPVKVSMKGQELRYQVTAKGKTEVLKLVLGAKGQSLHLLQGGKWVKLPEKRYAENFGDTSLSFEDLALRFLYWRGGKIEGKDNIQGVACYRVLLKNPDKRGRYAWMKVWIGQKGGELMKIEGFDATGKRVKRLSIARVMKLNGGYFVQSMKIEPFIGDGRRAGRPTTLNFNKPKRVVAPPQ